MALGYGRMAVAVGNHFPLFGEAHTSFDAAMGLRKNGPVCRSATAANGAAPAVEDLHGDAGAPAHFAQVSLRSIQGPGRPQEPALLVAVGIADHNFLKVAAEAQMLAIDRQM